jgi:hypothetical protein
MENIEMPKCEYGCGREAKFQIGKNRKWCCSESYKSCPGIREKISKGITGKNLSNETKNKIRESMKGKNTGPRSPLSEDHKNKIRESMKGKNTGPRSEETKEKIRESIKGKTQSKETKEKRSKSLKGKPKSEEAKKNMRYTIEDWIKKYPLLSKEEELRYHPKTGKIQGHCKYNECKNSKENGGWFTLYKRQLECRIVGLEYGNDGCYFYCCDECKQQCPLFYLRSDPYENKELLYTDKEKEIFRQEVLKRDNNKCIYCGEKAEHVHHTRPQKLEPFFSLDPDYGISTCGNCHYKYGHKTGTECSTGNLANVICT